VFIVFSLYISTDKHVMYT